MDYNIPFTEIDRKVKCPLTQEQLVFLDKEMIKVWKKWEEIISERII